MKMLFSDAEGNIYDHPEWEAAGMSGRSYVRASVENLIPLPEGSSLFTMPGHYPVGFDKNGKPAAYDEPGVSAVAAFIPAGWLRLLLPGVFRQNDASVLPLWAYSLVGWDKNRFVVPALRVDPDTRCEPEYYRDDEILAEKVTERLQNEPQNRLLRQLARCALEYHCFAAKNVFNVRWELPLPTSPACNARCVGCISLQPSQCCPSSQERLNFIPTVDEICDIACPHLKTADRPVASFGQGCEGEPLMQEELLEKSIREIRSRVSRGTINLNTNGSIPQAVLKLADAGLDSIRISLNSAQPHLYQKYHKPVNYSFRQVLDSIKNAHHAGLYTSLNLLVMPGITDTEQELDALMKLHHDAPFHMIQFRNLNIDPHLYLDALDYPSNPGMGLVKFIEKLVSRLPHIQIGYFNPLKEDFKKRLHKVAERNQNHSRRNIP